MRFVLLSAAVGLLIAFLFAGAWQMLEGRMDLYRSVHPFLSAVQTLLWPSSFFMIAAAGGGPLYWQLLGLAALVNGFFYGLIGLLVWLGAYKTGIGFVAAALLLLLTWAFLFTF